MTPAAGALEAPATSQMMRLRNISKRFGGLAVLRDVSFDLTPGEICGLIGPNGAGKTTLVNIISGVLRANGGTIQFEDRRIERLPAYRIARLGIARTFQVVQPFPHMSVLENVMAPAMFAGGCRSIATVRTRAAECLDVVGLSAVLDQPAAQLTLPNRKRLEFAKGLAIRPRLLLLDEVNAGLNATEMDSALSLIRAVAARGITIILIEHLMKVILQACSRVIVLHEGTLIADGAPGAIVKEPAVIDAYLGTGFAGLTAPPRTSAGSAEGTAS